MKNEPTPAQQLEMFLNFVDQAAKDYNHSHDIVNREDRRVQDFLHAIEFADDEDLYGIADELRQSRRLRRQHKDNVQLNKETVDFFGDQKNRDTINRMRQLLGRQRKQEEYLNSEREYKPRVEDAE